MAFLFRRKTKTKHGQRKIVYYIQWTDPRTKKLCKLSTKKSVLSEAREVFRQWELVHILGTDSNIFLSELIKAVLQYVKINLKSSYSLYEYALRMFLEITCDKKISLVTPYDLEHFKIQRLDSPNKNDPRLNLSARSVNKEVATIKAAFNKAIEIGLISCHKLARVKLIKVAKSTQIETYSASQLELILSKIISSGFFKAVILAINTGMRLNEVINLQIKDIDMNRKLLFIRNKPDIGFKTKTSQERVIPVNELLYNYFLEWFGISSNVTSIYDENTFVVNYEGNKYRKDTISMKFRNLIHDLRLHGSFHTLRHTFATNLNLKGVDIQTVRELMGHSNIRTTAIYFHSNNELKFSAVNKL